MINLKYIVCSLGLLSFFLCLFQEGNPRYENLFALPLSLILMSLLFGGIFGSLKNSVVFNLLILQAVLRYCIVPHKIASGEDITGFNSPNGEAAIFLMIVEIALTFVILYFVAPKQKDAYINRTIEIIPIKNSIFIYGLILILALYIYTSGYFSKVNLVWKLDSFVQKYAVEGEELGDTGFAAILFTPLKTITAIFLMSVIYTSKKILYSKKKYAYLSIIIISSLFIIGTSRLSIVFFALPLLILATLILDRKSSRKLISFFIIFFIPIILVASIAKFTRNEQKVSTESFFDASTLNGYFAGPGNVATGLDAHESLVIKDYPLFFINDIIQNLPGLAKQSSDLYKTNNVFNKTIYGHNLIRDQIVPLSVAGVFHFGIFGSFIYAPLFLAIAFYMERKSYNESFLGFKYFYISLSITLSMVFMLNIGSMYFALVASFLFIYIPFYVINFLQKLKQ